MGKRLVGVLAVGGAAVGLRALARKRREAELAEAERRPADIGFMYAMHAAFRRDLARLTDACRREQHGADVRAGWSLLRTELDSHHRAEDEDLWPKLRTHLTAADDLTRVDTMTREHRAIEELLQPVEDALGTEGAAAATEQLARVVGDHLDHEEREVLPLVETYLSDREWHEFLFYERDKHRPRDRATFLTWVLDDAAPQHEAAVLRELPPPGQYVYRRVLRPAHERRHLWAQSKATQPYHPSVGQAMANKLLTKLLARGRGPEALALLTVRGRRTGRRLTTPVAPVEHDDRRWIVAPFGEVDWVRNARAAGEIELRRGDEVHNYAIEEVAPAEAVPVLRDYLAMPSAKYVRNYFEVTPESSDEAIAAEAPRHPVFALH